MKHIKKFLLLIAAVATMAVTLSSCFNSRYITTDDDEWSQAEWGGDNLLLNGELEIDDYER